MISLVVATDQNGLIGDGNKLPWHVPAELKHFKRVTDDGIVIFGRKTYESIPEKLRPLTGRKNVVISKSCFTNDTYLGCETFSDLDNAIISCVRNSYGRQIFICGGNSIYKQTIPFADRIYLSVIKGSYSGNVYFPGCSEINPKNAVIELISQGFMTARYINYETWDFYLMERFPVYNTL